ncbi:MaoC family dehydratase N-terminal domain-containing protein [Eubacteriales bacterium OttesenSCG-928-M02]|nr:MaoC family dehydratase N-terminal domain-containing protein [Eubacteriales bacterium OttesenSCG-928-M02]
MHFEGFPLGKEFPLQGGEIGREEVISFAQQYDPIPLHMDESYGKTTRYGDIIAPGVMTFMRLWADFLRMGLLDDTLIAGKSTHIEWNAPVFIGDYIDGVAVVTDRMERNDYNGFLEITIRGYNQKRDLVLTNVTELVVARKQREMGASPWENA